MARPRANVVHAIVVSLALVFVTAACASSPTATPSTTGAAQQSSQPSSAAADPAKVAAATTVLKSAKLGDPGSLAALERVRFTAGGTDAASKLISSGATGDTLWAATYVYATSGSDPAPLRSLATGTAASPSIRAMAAAGLVGRGDLAGFDALIAAIGGSSPMDGAAPAGAIWEFAADVLERYTHTGFGPKLAATQAERATIQARWQGWLDQNKARLRFDGPSGLWVPA